MSSVNDSDYKSFRGPAVGGGMMVRLRSSSARAVEAVSGPDDKAGQEEEERGREARGQRDQQKVKDSHPSFTPWWML
jgi:hypothetical protein